MVRVLVISHYFETHRGGVEIVAKELASRLARAGHSVTWAASGIDRDGTAPDIGVRRLPMWTCNFTEEHLGFPYPIWSPLSLFRLFRAAREADVVHAHDCLYIGSVAACVFSILLGRPFLLTQHISEVRYSNRILRCLMRLANRSVGHFVLRRSCNCVFYSRVVQDYFSRALDQPERARFISNGVDRDVFVPLNEDDRRRLRAMLNWPDDRWVCLFVGRFVERKGLAVLHDMARGFSECHWAFVGRGPIDPGRWRLSNVEVIGSVDHYDLGRYYQAADLLVLPSVGEGFPLVVQEAMSCGTPALISQETARAVPGIQGVALTADPTPSAMQSAFRQLLSQPDVLTQRRAAVTAFARKSWHWPRAVGQYAEILAAAATASR